MKPHKSCQRLNVLPDLNAEKDANSTLFIDKSVVRANSIFRKANAVLWFYSLYSIS
ncbi:hypothetical protein HMPREF0454_04280 [Hafnia alvei ATCC 51873]|uniref:Uncharacterized protein n=1 Tax=Hafnia alvei ATCC 51873 TaxID=1002364 RepID=G9YCE5_HAFAL|nr:hypothetical protein HMPREF0454_04280 [Hafnia alvei ATCC 51873]